MEFDFFLLSIIILTSLLCFKIASFKFNPRQKVLLFFTFIFITIYSGLGGALLEATKSYVIYYAIYIFILALTIRSVNVGIDFSKDKVVISNFVDRNAKKMIILFFSVKMASLVFPEFKLQNLISPPPPSLEDFDFSAEGENYSGGAIGSVLYLANNFIMPFFYLALYKYRRNIKRIVLLIILSLYLTYCNSGYVGRGTILQAGIISFFTIYFSLSAKNRKFLIILSLSSVPFLILGFYYYSLMRLGLTLESISFSQAADILFGQEISYPLHFNNYIEKSGNYAFDYLEWLILQPLPGFLKFGYGNFFLNRTFSMDILGVDVNDYSFFILLPGIVGESIYVFGPIFFIIHPIILGCIIKFVLRTFTSLKVFEYIFYFCIVQFSFLISRAGTVSVYPVMFKSLLILVIVCILVRKKKNI